MGENLEGAFVLFIRVACAFFVVSVFMAFAAGAQSAGSGKLADVLGFTGLGLGVVIVWPGLMWIYRHVR